MSFDPQGFQNFRGIGLTRLDQRPLALVAAGGLLRQQAAAMRAQQDARRLAPVVATIFSQFSSPEGSQFAQLLRDNPDRGLAMLQQIGGPGKVLEFLNQRETSQRAAGRAQALNELSQVALQGGVTREQLFSAAVQMLPPEDAQRYVDGLIPEPEAPDHQVVQLGDGSTVLVDKATGDRVREIGGPRPVEGPKPPSPFEVRKEFLSSTKDQRASLSASSRGLSLVDGARSAKGRGRKAALQAASALKAFVQSIDNSVVREGEARGAVQSLGLWERAKSALLGTTGDVPDSVLDAIEDAILSLSSGVLPQIQSQVDLLAPEAGTRSELITEYPEATAFRDIQRRLAEREQRTRAIEERESMSIGGGGVPRLEIDPDGTVTGVR